MRHYCLTLYILARIFIGHTFFEVLHIRTPNEGINQRELKIWADGAVPKNLGVRVDFHPCNFLTGRP